MSHIINSNGQLQHIISKIYDAALEQSQWNNVIDMLTQTLKAEQGYMSIIDTSSNNVQQAYCYNKDHSWDQEFKDYYVHLDPWLNNILRSKNTFMASTHHYISNNEYEAMEYYQDFIRPQNIHYGLGGIVNIGDNITAYLALNRSKEKQGFQNEYLENLQLITPHLQKSLLINEKTRNLELERNLLSDALNEINGPVLLVNKSGKILFINIQAEKLIEQQTGIIIINNHIVIRSSKDNKALHQLITQATHKKAGESFQQGGAMNYTDPTSQQSLSLLVSPINPDRANIDTREYESALILVNTNQQQPALPAELLTSLYKLSQAEARLTIHLCQGLTLAEISEQCSLSINTIKTQLRSCFRKVGVSRQAELIRVVNSGAFN